MALLSHAPSVLVESLNDFQVVQSGSCQDFEDIHRDGDLLAVLITSEFFRG